MHTHKHHVEFNHLYSSFLSVFFSALCVCMRVGPGSGSDGDSDPGSSRSSGWIVSSASGAGDPRRRRLGRKGSPSETPPAATAAGYRYRGSTRVLTSDLGAGSSKPRPAAELCSDPRSRHVGTAAWDAAATTGQRERPRRNRHAR